MPLDHISHAFRAIWKKEIFKIWKPIEKIKLFNPPFYLQLKSKTP